MIISIFLAQLIAHLWLQLSEIGEISGPLGPLSFRFNSNKYYRAHRLVIN